MWAKLPFVLSQSTRLIEGQTDGRTDWRTDTRLSPGHTVCYIICSRTVKIHLKRRLIAKLLLSSRNSGSLSLMAMSDLDRKPGNKFLRMRTVHRIALYTREQFKHRLKGGQYLSVRTAGGAFDRRWMKASRTNGVTYLLTYLAKKCPERLARPAAFKLQCVANASSFYRCNETVCIVI